jgi:uncharacterized OB-fold protein
MTDTTEQEIWPEVLTRVPPLITGLTEFFWTGGADGILRMLACQDCGMIIHPPSPVCPRCLSRNVAPRELSGKATVYTYTVNYQAWVPGQEPYVVAIVKLAEDDAVRLTTNIVCVDPEEVRIGMDVEVQFVEWEGLHLPCFRPVAGEATA